MSPKATGSVSRPVDVLVLASVSESRVSVSSRTESTVVKYNLVTLVVIMILEDTAAFQVLV